ncbi:hypothetical protein CI109_103269 [Kwoniella shandongensis]|uniref:Uncharacterized protein n=1 Tax=Kwoniella shandongensis TaxID=1734106 RepID=A0A5M6BRT2_9TREE|nr:uncharacterized protein CI109_006059 [Kwoniella shandongensis]KAA5525608.1 hypothetical protein CI109_006059 [Kwoniella shandongensis]
MFSITKTALFATLAATFVAAAPSFEKRADNAGTATYFDAGLGACGWTNSNSDYIVAVNSAQYEGAKCGQKLWLWNPATQKMAFPTVADECPSCSSGDLDLSTGLFEFLADGNMDQGIFEMKWGYL